MYLNQRLAPLEVPIQAGQMQEFIKGLTAIILDISAIIAIIVYYQEANTNIWTG